MSASIIWIMYSSVAKRYCGYFKCWRFRVRVLFFINFLLQLYDWLKINTKIWLQFIFNWYIKMYHILYSIHMLLGIVWGWGSRAQRNHRRVNITKHYILGGGVQRTSILILHNIWRRLGKIWDSFTVTVKQFSTVENFNFFIFNF
jgi:hypothetical protein